MEEECVSAKEQAEHEPGEDLFFNGFHVCGTFV